ncbi:MAG: alpha/beta hydrolase [Rhodospirillaceae bacterium]|nr:alpha/beta hydrolase [Rhodospirillaceae bacterium]MDE0362286.1 alpha/beta hydrolase [Rhodospirillaceae bacterium]
MQSSIWNELQGVGLKQTWYDAGGIRTRVIEAGAGYPLFLLHGTGGHAEAYSRNIAAHAEHFRVIAYDMVGHGYTDAPDIEYDEQAYVDHLRSLMDSMDIQAAYLSGESLGGSVAAWFALQHSERVGKLVLNTGLPLSPNTQQGIDQMKDFLVRSRKATGTPTREALAIRMKWLFLDEASLTDELLETRFRIYSQSGRAAAIRKLTERAIGGLIDPANQKTWYRPDQLRELTCPTLLLWTNHNPGQPVELARQAAADIPDARVVVLDNSSHWPQWEEPEAFNKAQIEFLLG